MTPQNYIDVLSKVYDRAKVIGDEVKVYDTDEWLLYGYVDDPATEFMIQADHADIIKELKIKIKPPSKTSR